MKSLVTRSNLLSDFDVLSYIEEKGIVVINDEGGELACLCPFHNNQDSPAFYINKSTGLWICFNPSCGKRGSIKDLMLHYGDTTVFKKRERTIDEIEALLDHLDDVEETEDWGATLEKIRDTTMLEDLWYMTDRGFTPETLAYFEIAYSEKKKRIVIPVRDERFKVIGFLGRATNKHTEPKYLNSKGLPRRDHLFNLCNAKSYPSVIIVEGTTDAMRVFQAGYKNVVASLGAEVTQEHFDLLNDYFNEITIFSDNDEAGFIMRNKIIKNCFTKRLNIVVYQNGLHDPGEMTEEQIVYHIENAKEFFEWTQPTFADAQENVV